MPGLYVDTSALGRVLLGEPDAPAVIRDLAGFERHIASRLLRIELTRLAIRKAVRDAVERLLTGIALIPLDDATLTAAERIPPASVGTLDAIHLATAVRLADAGLVDAVMTYDARLAACAREHGLAVLAPA